MCDLKAKLDQWKEWCFGNDVHSVSNQIHNMIRDSAVFQCINEARGHAPKDKNGEPKLNGTVHAFINRCFFQTQAMAIRRLLDRRQDVVSLRRLINDIQENCELLTRAGLLGAYGYPYDYEPERANLHGKYDQGHGQAAAGGLIKCAHSKAIHGFMDSMAGVEPSRRKPDDRPREAVFRWLLKRLHECEAIVNFVNKYVAHSATADSRAKVNTDMVTLGKILEAHRMLCETAEIVGMNILFQSHGNFLAIPQYDQFEYFEKPWATEGVVKELREFWDDYYKATGKWKDWDWQAEFNESAEK
ncbi:MAG: hypothetical protein JSU94_04650 [Phycisphaerales bacterium]|nr:MAG: hypothetical protein JSU94_04650 [Phycisphaerales bacterium]